MSTEAINGTTYRSLINDKEIKYERSVSFEPDEIRITIYTNEVVYREWLKRKDEVVNFKVTNTNINLQMVIQHVLLIVRLEEVVEVVIKLWSEGKVRERNSFLGK